MGEAMKYFPRKVLDHEIFRSMVSWAAKIILKNVQNNPPSPPSPPAPPPTYLMYSL